MKKKNIKNCPYCDSKLLYFFDYDKNKWLGCPKCENYEVLIKDAEKNIKFNESEQ